MIVGSGKKRSETVYSGRKRSEKLSEKVWKSLNLDSILSEKSGNNPEKIRKKSSARIQSHIAFPGFSWTFPRLVQIFSRIYPEKSEKIGKTVGKSRKNCRKRSEKVGFFFRTEILPTIMESTIRSSKVPKNGHKMKHV